VQNLPAPAPPPIPVQRSALADSAFDVPPTLAERIELCQFLAEADLLPQALKKRPANVLLIMHKALALGVPLSVALEHLHVIDGKVGHSAELLRGLLVRHGHRLDWVTVTDTLAECKLTLRHRKEPIKVSFTLAEAQKMKLTSKDNWTKNPQAMLVARCSTRAVSWHCPEVSLALGNLSAMDAETEDNPRPDAAATAADSSAHGDDLVRDHQASEMYLEAKQATTKDELKSIGTRARNAGLLEIPVDGDLTLQTALLSRLNEMNESAKGKSGKAAAGDASQ
jgi:hypothetical protein